MTRKLLLTSVCLMGMLTLSGATLISQIQGAVTAALVELKFKDAGADKPGAPQQFEVTQKTLDYLQKLLNNGKKITVNAKGEVKVK